MVTRAETPREQVMPRHAPPRERRTGHVASTARAVSKKPRPAGRGMDGRSAPRSARAGARSAARQHALDRNRASAWAGGNELPQSSRNAQRSSLSSFCEFCGLCVELCRAFFDPGMAGFTLSRQGNGGAAEPRFAAGAACGQLREAYPNVAEHAVYSRRWSFSTGCISCSVRQLYSTP